MPSPMGTAAMPLLEPEPEPEPEPWENDLDMRDFKSRLTALQKS